MPRTDRPLGGEDSELVQFASDLRRLRERAGRPSYRELARDAHYSATTLSDAAGGRRLPTLAVLLAYVRACDGNAAEWEQRWRRLAGQPAEIDAPAPYPGLTALQTEDADRFFGRGALVEEILSRLGDERFLVVMGASGVGKSSLLRAGVVARLQAQGSDVEVMTPGVHPLAEWERLAGDLVVVDQFEEVFTLCQDKSERAAFIDAVTGFSGRVILGLRLDFFAHCADHPRLREAVFQRQVLVGALSTDELRQVVVGPAERAGCTVEGQLVAEVVAAAGGRAGVLPLVSHALLETWRRRTDRALTLAGYREAGGIEQALANTAEQLYTSLSPRRQWLTRTLMLRLTTFGEGTPDTRRRIARDELDSADPDLVAVLDLLTRARLVTVGRSSAELSHEALISAWPRLHSWLAGDRDDLRTHRALTQATQEWQAHGRDEGALLRGARLLSAREWTERDDHASELTASEKAFLQASNDLAAHERDSGLRRERQLRRLSLGLVVSLVVSLVVGVVAVVQRREAVEAKGVAVSRQLAIQAPTLANSRPDTAMLLSVQAWRTSPTAEARGALLSMSSRSAYENEFIAHDAPISELTFAPDGTLLTASRDATLGIWELNGHNRIAALSDHKTWLRSVAVSPDGSSVASGGDDHAVTLWDLRSRVRSAVLTDHTGAVTDVKFSPDGKLLASGSADGSVGLWDVAGRSSVGQLKGDVGAVSSVGFSPDSRFVALGGETGKIEIWDAGTRERVHEFTSHEGPVRQLAFDPQGRYLATAGDLAVKMWDVSGDFAQDVRVLEGHTGEVRTIAFSPDGSTLASAGIDRTVMLWDVSAGTPRARLGGHTTNVYSLAFGSDSRLASAGERGSVIVWDTTRVPLTSIDPDGINDLAFSPDGRTTAHTAGARTILRDTARRLQQRVLTGASPVVAVAFGPDSALLATGYEDGGITLWNPQDGTEQGRLEGHTQAVLDVAFSPDGRTLVSGGADNAAIVWDLAEQTRKTTLAGHDGPVNGVAFSPDGRTVATAGHDSAVLLWDASTWTPHKRLSGHTGWVRTVAFSPDGSTVASAGSDSTVRLWEAASGAARRTLTGYLDSEYGGLAFSPDGSTLAFTGGEFTVSLWDLATRTTSARLSGHTAAVRTLAFSPDGHTLASAGEDLDQAVRFWDTDAAAVAGRICAGLARDLTEDEWSQFVPDQPRKDTC